MHVIESIGPILGIVAFVGLATLAFLLFQQARDIRRLREWAGRAPERAQEAAEAVQAVAEASRGEADAGGAAGAQEATSRRTAGRGVGAVAGRGRPSGWRRWTGGFRSMGATSWPLVAILVVAAGVLTSGFGVCSGGDDGKRHDQEASPKPHVAVLNGTASRASRLWWPSRSSRPPGYKTGTVANAGSSIAEDGGRCSRRGTSRRPRSWRRRSSRSSGTRPTKAMTADVTARAKGAPLALGLGLDDAQFGGGSG